MVADNLKSIRISKGWSQSFVANQLGIAQRTISRAECGCGVSKRTLEMLCSMYQVSVASIYGECVQENPREVQVVPDDVAVVHKERLMKFMKHSARVPSSNKIVEKKFVRIGEGSMTYSIGHHRFIEMARAAGAIYKIGEAKGNTILINLEVFDEYMEQFRETPTEMKHPLPNVKGD